MAGIMATLKLILEIKTTNRGMDLITRMTTILKTAMNTKTNLTSVLEELVQR